MLRCFSDENLDFAYGFQVLHATYIVEQTLNNLVKRKGNFQIAFFDSNRALCVPPSAKLSTLSKYYFARAAIIRHLQSHLPRSHPGITVHLFRSYTCSDFKQYLLKSAPYFIMAHDGAKSATRMGKHTMEDEGTSPVITAWRTSLRRMILSFIACGFNVALLNGLEWRDTKVMTMILEGRHFHGTHFESDNVSFEATIRNSVEISSELNKLKMLPTELTPRQNLIVIAAAKLIAASQPSGLKKTVTLCATLLHHQALLTHMPLSARRLRKEQSSPEARDFLSAAASMCEDILLSDDWDAAYSEPDFEFDIVDAIDGRLFLQLSSLTGAKLGGEASKTFHSLSAAFKHLSDVELPSPVAATNSNTSEDITTSKDVITRENGLHDIAVLPFSNPIFDKHLQSVHLKIDEDVGDNQSMASHRIFLELSHWHNSKRLLVQKVASTPASDKAAFWAAKRNQLFMSEMRTYAASLTNSVGKSLEPESIVIGGTKKHTTDPAIEVSKSHGKKGVAGSPADSDTSDSTMASKHKAALKKGGGKTAQLNVGKQKMMSNIAAKSAMKAESAGDKTINAWHTVCKNIETDQNIKTRFRMAKDYLSSVKTATKDLVEAEVNLYLINQVLQYWIQLCVKEEHERRVEVTALIWNLCQVTASSKGLTKTIMSNVSLTIKMLGLPDIWSPSVEPSLERTLPFSFALPAKPGNLSVDLQPTFFQLTHAGPYLERSFNSKPDNRVEFVPDGWQRSVLDAIDAEQSVFVVAPTSSGKTFISFYAMRKVLEADDDGVLVYVAPTKALVNQIAAEIQARYSKKFKYGGKSVWAIHTRDHRINNPSGCQVLVTVPHILQIMLLAPSNANSWSSRVKRIIFDEIHSIGQAEDGVVWEQLLLMVPCAIIALSATVGNPSEFSDWLGETQRGIGVDLVTVSHKYRYSDLRKYYYVHPKLFSFNGLSEKSSFGTLGIEGLIGFTHIHPVAALVDRSRGIPDDLGMEPRDCLELWKVMVEHQRENYMVPSELSPEKYFPTICKKADVLKWEEQLKALLRVWIADDASPYGDVVATLEKTFRREEQEELQVTRPSADQKDQAMAIHDDLLETTLPMLCSLHTQDALPAILFNYDRHMCESICKAIHDQLQAAELSQKKSGPSWEKTLEKWEQWKKVQEKTTARQSKAVGKKSKGIEDEKMSKLDQQRDAADSSSSQWDTFDPDAPAEGYHFADYSRVQLSEMQTYTRQLGRRNVPQWLINSLKRGIGVHHAGLNRKLRQVVEILFRKGFLRVVIATGTLALGINMPAKTTIFSGDSVFLTALNYRQCAGRAGRRGFDLLGNVIFQGISREKVCRLISSRLPDLTGHFPITTSLVLRLFTLLHESQNSKYAVSAINGLLSQPRLFMGAPSFKDQTMHHLRFSIEYLRRQHLLAMNGAPLNFAGMVSHLYFTENSSFAFHALLKEGYFHELCAGVNKNEKVTLETLMLVMAHLFNRTYCRQADAEYREKVVKPSSSIVFLPPLPKNASQILREHNKQTLDVYRTYVETFIDQHIQDDDCTLPFTGMKVGSSFSGTGDLVLSLPRTKIRSPFVALSGHGDKFETIHDLCSTTRDGVFLEEAVIPHVDVSPDDMDTPLNAYLLDFFKHGDVFTIERANGIRRSDIWFLLNDFSLVLATITTSLLNFMKLKEGTDMDMLDVMGDLDIHEEDEDNDVAAEEEQQSDVFGPSTLDSVITLSERPKQVSKKKAKNTESWEDIADEEDALHRREERRAANEAQLKAETAEALTSGQGSNEGLKDVLKAFQKLHKEFTTKFRAMWA